MHWSEYADTPFQRYLNALWRYTKQQRRDIEAISHPPAVACICGRGLLQKRIDANDEFYWQCDTCGRLDGNDDTGRPAALRQWVLRG